MFFIPNTSTGPNSQAIFGGYVASASGSNPFSSSSPPKPLVNLDGLSAGPTQPFVAKNPFSTTNTGKMQWDFADTSPKPTLSQLSSPPQQHAQPFGGPNSAYSNSSNGASYGMQPLQPNMTGNSYTTSSGNLFSNGMHSSQGFGSQTGFGNLQTTSPFQGQGNNGFVMQQTQLQQPQQNPFGANTFGGNPFGQQQQAGNQQQQNPFFN
jgi:hypothetical protein